MAELSGGIGRGRGRGRGVWLNQLRNNQIIAPPELPLEPLIVPQPPRAFESPPESKVVPRAEKVFENPPESEVVPQPRRVLENPPDCKTVPQPRRNFGSPPESEFVLRPRRGLKSPPISEPGASSSSICTTTSESETSDSSSDEDDEDGTEGDREDNDMEHGVVPSSGASAITTDSDEEKEEIEERGKQDLDFPAPRHITIKSVGDYFKENRIHKCVAGQIVSPSEFYLTLAIDVPEELNYFIDWITGLYEEWSSQPRSEQFTLNQKPQHIFPGSYVACWNPTDNALRDREIVRARVLSEIPHPDASELSGGTNKNYRVFLIDLAQYAEVGISEMLFLHKDFTKAHAWAVKCRFYLDEYYDRYHNKEQEWKEKTIRFMMDVLKCKERKLKVRFVRQVPDVDDETQKIWEVSILEIEPPRKHIEPNHRVEKQIIKKTNEEGYIRLKRFDLEQEIRSSGASSSTVRSTTSEMNSLSI